MKQLKRDDRHYHGKPKRDRKQTQQSVGKSKRRVRTDDIDTRTPSGKKLLY